MPAEFFKSVSWVILVILSVIAVIGTVATYDGFGVLAVTIGMCIGVAVGWGYVLGWLFGLNRHVNKHLNMSAKTAAFVSKQIGSSHQADFEKLLEKLFADQDNAIRFGMQVEYGVDLANLQQKNIKLQAIKWQSRETLDESIEVYPTNAVYLLKLDGKPYVVSINAVHSEFSAYEEDTVIGTGSGASLQLFAQTIDDARAIVNYLVKHAPQSSVYRGKLLHVSTPRDGLSRNTIRIHTRPSVEADRIILPDEIITTLDRIIAARLKHSEVLNRHGHSSKFGILLHGPPGTGKTLVSKYLIGNAENFTGIVLGDLDFESIRESFRLAAYLHPAIIVIEDVDLLAERREKNFNVTALQQLMNELDGLAPTCETIVVMSTNRPEALEPALASRPGRVSQAIEFPLPDQELREKLINLFCPNTDTTGVDINKIVNRTAGSSPAFLEELSKRAILFAAERSPEVNGDLAANQLLELNDNDFDQAVHELVVFGGQMTKGILGFNRSE